MKKIIKKAICICAIVVGVSTVAPVTAFAQTDATTEGDTSNLARAIIAQPNAEVTADGVRLRKTPSATGTIVELMYTGETVCVDITKTTTSGGIRWYYVTRIMDGTCGWVSSQYIELW